MSKPTAKPATASVICRIPRLADASAVRDLVDACKPLDLNSSYAYMLLCTHFAATCVVAETEGRLVGFVSGYKKPADDSVLFVWQVAVSPRVRGQGLGKRMLEELIERRDCRAVRWVEATITSSNAASWALFKSFAETHGASCAQETIFRAKHFGAEQHEEELLLRIGPLHPNTKGSNTKEYHANIQ